ncbi:MAG TPA: DUF5668 domain-containing protein [Acidobacteriota bacterium]|nr:DUF5668 domain-containing protein [Acidobacteriota bacterium]
MNRTQTIIIGVALIILGAYLLLSEYGYPFRIHVSWPVILLVVGGALIAAYYISKPKTTYLFSGSLVFWLGVFFMLMENALEYYYGYSHLWPGFIIVIGLAHLTTAVLSQSARKHLAAASLFIAVGVVLLFFTFTGWRTIRSINVITAIAVITIIIGFKYVLEFFLTIREKR